ncbi:hypothetical protein Tco_1381071 [Tanacetum coccineum]
MILGRPFLATIHAEIDVFNKEISLGIREDRVTFDMDKKIHNFMTPEGKEQSSKKARMLKPDTNTPSAHFCKPVKKKCNEILKIGDDKTIFNMPRAKRKLNKLTIGQHNMMSPILKFSDEDKAKGICHPYQKIKEFYRRCLDLGDEYKQDLEVIDWIKRGHASVHESTFLQQGNGIRGHINSYSCGKNASVWA